MSGSPTLNRSFLHGNIERASTKKPSENIVYATLDCLALKRTRLPLQLVPVQSNDSHESICKNYKIDGGDKKTATNNRKASSRRPSFKIRPGASLHWKQRHKVNIVTGKFENPSKESGVKNSQSLQFKIGNLSKVPYSKNNVGKTVPELLDMLIEGDAASEPLDFEDKIKSNNKQDKSISHRKRNKTDTKKQVNKISGSVEDEIEEGSVRKLGKDDRNCSSIQSINISDNKVDLNSYLNEANDKDELETGYSTIESIESNPLKKSEEIVLGENCFEDFKKKAQIVIEESLTRGDNKSNLISSKLKTLSREELRNIKISKPTNFVHLASATNKKLIVNNGNSSNLSPVVAENRRISILPLISAKELNGVESLTKDWCNRNLTNGGKLKTEAKIKPAKYVPMIPLDLKSNEGTSNVRSKAEFFNRIIGDVGTKKEPLKRLCPYEELIDYRQELKRDNNNASEFENNGQVVNPAVVKTCENEAEEKIYEVMSDIPSRPKPNSSFLWSNQQIKISKSLASLTNEVIDDRSSSESNRLSIEKSKTQLDSDDDDYEKYEEYEEHDEYDEYDHVGPPREPIEMDDYDDVGPMPVSSVEKEIEKSIEEDVVYDDVLPLNCTPVKNISSVSAIVEEDYLLIPNTDMNNDKLERTDSISNLSRRQFTQELDITLRKSNGPENQYLSINNDYSSLDELSSDRDVYDDVGLPSEERVNSLYAGSLSELIATTREESEWEDLDETPPPPYPLPQWNGTGAKGGGGELQSAPSKKKLGLTWSHKVRIQRSKASRENSARSSAQNTRDHTSADSGSDNSNYETLYSSQLDDFSTDSETDRVENPEDNDVSLPGENENIYAEAPSRPTPPPPREASLSQTLGRRMKLLRRTWSLTKGSLGRIRKKSSGEQETIYSEAVPRDHAGVVGNHNTADYKKYFSFKKHFRKSVTGLSTFYLNNNENNSNQAYADNKDKIYGNGNWSSGESRSWQDDDSIRSQNSGADPYNLLAEEPLYQFYTAAAARVAFESDSDGYEEVEDLIPTQAATDLAKPGQRTLWCQTPQVVNSGLHQRLTADERRLQEAKFEIFTSEASYLSSLRVLEEEFIKNLDVNSGILTVSERTKLFGGVPGIRKASERLLADLENVWTEDPMMYGLPDVLLKHAKRSCNVYVQYCSNQVSIDTTLKELRGRKGSKFLEFLTSIEAHSACQSLSLHSFLMLPMQRVTRLPLLADAVLTKLSSDHQERISWENVLSSLSRVVAECNEGARAAGRQAEMEALARKLEYSSKLTPVTLRDKYMIRSGPVTQLLPKTDVDYKLTFGKKLNKVSLYLFLLTDYLLVTKPKLSSPEETYTVIDTCKRNLVTMESVPEDSQWAGRHAMILTLLENHSGREVEFVLTCESDTELTRWMDVISPPKSSLIGETLYESWDCPQVMALYSYAPVQPDELALHPGDVINVLRKMADGWNHGEKLLDGEQGWFPANYTKEVASEHVRARNLKQRHRLLSVTGNLFQKKSQK